MNYSQAEQDLFVLNFLNYKKKGYFLDIGSHDGISFSNTYLLEKEYNWNGLCVELNNDLFCKLSINRSCYKSNKVINTYNGFCEFEENDFIGKINKNGINKECITIRDLLVNNNVLKLIDYFSLDIEGFEYEVLNSFLFNEYSFKSLTVEHNKYNCGEEIKNKIYKLLIKNNYIRVKEDVLVNNTLLFEDWYIHKDYLKQYENITL